MSETDHNVIIGTGIAGNRAAETLRERDPDCRITIVTLGSLLFYNRYSLPKVFQGCDDWRDLLVHPPSYYQDNRITLRRNTRAINVDAKRKAITFAHNEEMRYDNLLVCSGGRGYLPEGLSDYARLMHRFTTFEDAITVRRLLPAGGRVILMGGDMIGLDLARTLVETGHEVTLVATDFAFWPHEVAKDERQTYDEALKRMGIEVHRGARVTGLEEGAKGKPARRVLFADGKTLDGDVVMPFYGLVPSVEFMLGSGIDIERGILVNPLLCSTDDHIWAAGDVCQIWSQEKNAYRFYYGWNNVRAMGEAAARNITGDAEPFVNGGDEDLRLDDNGHIHSPFWDHD